MTKCIHLTSLTHICDKTVSIKCIAITKDMGLSQSVQCSAQQDHVLDVLDHHHAGHARRVLVVLDVVAGHRHRGQHVHHHEDPLEDGEVRGEDDGGEQRGHAEGEVVQRPEIFILLQPQCVEVDGRNCLDRRKNIY